MDIYNVSNAVADNYVVDVDKGVIEHTSNKTIQQGEHDSRFIQAKLVKGDMSVDLTNCDVFFLTHDAKYQEIPSMTKCNIVSAANGEVSVLIKDYMSKNSGVIECEFVRVGVDETALPFKKFAMSVDGSIYTNSLIETSAPLSALIGALAKVQEVEKYLGTEFMDLEVKYAGELSKTNAQLSADKKELSTKIQEVAATGTTTEVVQSKVQEMAEQGLIQAYTLGDNTVEPEKTTFIDVVKSRNLFNKDSLENKIGYYLNWNNTDVALASVGISHKIYVNVGDTIKFFYCANASTNWGLIFDKNDNKLSAINTIGTSHKFGAFSWEYRSFVVPENASYIKINYTISRINDAVMCVVGDYPISEFIPYTIDNTLNNVKVKTSDIIGNFPNELTGKSMLTFGDSVMYGAGGSVGGFARIIAEKNNMTLYNKAKSGYTICLASDYPSRGSILKEVETSITNNDSADYILIEGGFNDVFNKSKCPIGIISTDYITFDTSTFSGALESLFKQVLTKWYDKKILFVLGHNVYRSFNDTDVPFDYWIKNQNTYWDRAIEICKKWNIPYIDIRLSGFIPLTDDLLSTYFAEANQSTHPNDLGYKIIYVDKVESKMKEM